MVFKIKCVELLEFLLEAPRIGSNPQKLQVAHAGDFNRILEPEKHTKTSPLLSFKLKQILAAITHSSGGDPICGMAGENLGKRALATAIPTHHGMNLARPHLKIHTLQDRLILHGRVEISDVEKKLGVGANHLKKTRKKVQ
jgi:hypothetical protein